MPARPKGPWWRKGRGFYCFINGQLFNLHTKDRAAAWDKFYAKMKEAGESVTVADRAPASVREVVERFIEWAEKHRKPMTFQHYDQFTKGFLKHAVYAKETPAVELRPFHVQEWIDLNPQWSTTTQNRAASTIKRAYSWAVEQGLIASDPIRSLKKAKPKRRLRILTDADWRQVAAGCFGYRSLLELLNVQRETGARPQELRAAEVQHFDDVGGCLRFQAHESKGGVARVIVLTQRAKEIVMDCIGGRAKGFVFLNDSGSPWTREGLHTALWRLGKRCGVAIDAYTARHTYATDALVRGLDAVTVGVLMGHVDPSMVGRIYSHLDQKPDYLREAAEAAVRSRSESIRRGEPEGQGEPKAEPLAAKPKKTTKRSNRQRKR